MSSRAVRPVRWTGETYLVISSIAGTEDAGIIAEARQLVAVPHQLEDPPERRFTVVSWPATRIRMHVAISSP